MYLYISMGEFYISMWASVHIYAYVCEHSHPTSPFREKSEKGSEAQRDYMFSKEWMTSQKRIYKTL